MKRTTKKKAAPTTVPNDPTKFTCPECGTQRFSEIGEGYAIYRGVLRVDGTFEDSGSGYTNDEMMGTGRYACGNCGREVGPFETQTVLAWGGEDYALPEAMRKAVEGFCVDALEQADCGRAVETNPKNLAQTREVRFAVRVTLLPGVWEVAP